MPERSTKKDFRRQTSVDGMAAMALDLLDHRQSLSGGNVDDATIEQLVLPACFGECAKVWLVSY